jgi:foldase protein PrsA
MNKTSDKGNDMEKFKDQIQTIAENTQMHDQSFQTRVIGEVLKAANVKVEDSSLSNILSSFMPTDASGSGTSGSESSTSGSN